MKIVILGAKGMLGRDLAGVFYNARPYLFDKDELDITDSKTVFKLFKNLKPDIVINAAAYTDVDGCEENRDLAKKVNADAPGYLAEACKDINAVFVHYSTDYVFSGDKKEGYNEEDEPSSPASPAGGPINFYGESKLAGEKAVRETGGKYYLIRTSWLFGLNGKNFVETILRLADEKKEIKVVNDQHGKPTFTIDLSQRTKYIIESKKDFGIYHVTNEPSTTWYDFAKEIVNNKNRAEILPCASEEFPRPAKRPRYSILLNTKLPPMRSWQEALREYFLYV